MGTSGEPPLDDQLPHPRHQEASELPTNQGEILADLSDSDEMFYYENGSNSAVFISAGIHCLVFLLLIYTWMTTFFNGAAEEETAQGGIVLVNNSSESPTYHQNPSETISQNASQAANTVSQLVEQNQTRSPAKEVSAETAVGVLVHRELHESEVIRCHGSDRIGIIEQHVAPILTEREKFCGVVALVGLTIDLSPQSVATLVHLNEVRLPLAGRSHRVTGI